MEDESAEKLNDFCRKLDNVSLQEAQNFAETVFDLIKNKYEIPISDIRQAVASVIFPACIKTILLKQLNR